MTPLPERPEQGRLLAGVCAAISEAWSMDVTLLRLAMIFASFAWGLGFLLYALLWLLLPAEGLGRRSGFGDVARDNLRQLRQELGSSRARFARVWRANDRKPWPRPLDRRWIAIGLVALGALVFLASLGAFGWITGSRALGLTIIGVGAALLVKLRQ